MGTIPSDQILAFFCLGIGWEEDGRRMIIQFSIAKRILIAQRIPWPSEFHSEGNFIAKDILNKAKRANKFQCLSSCCCLPIIHI